MKNKTNIPWFVFNNRDTEKKHVNILQERRAIVMTICFMTMLIGILALSAAYCTKILIALVAILAVIGAGATFRAIFLYCRGE